MSPTEAKEPEVLHGVALEAYAAVHAALGEGMDEARALAAAGVEPEAWPDADDAWSERLGTDFADEGPLQAAYDAHLQEAQARFGRPLPPVDHDLASWLDLVRHFAAAAEPLVLLKSLGLRGAEMTRLHRAWSKRLGDEPALRGEAAEILGRPPGPLPTLDLAVAPPAPLPARVVPRPAHDDGIDESAEAPPPLFGPLPTAADEEPLRPVDAQALSVAPRTQAPLTQAPATQAPITQDPITQEPLPPLSRIGAPFAPPPPVAPFATSPVAPPPLAPLIAPPPSTSTPFFAPAPLSGRAALSSTAPVAYAPPRSNATPFALTPSSAAAPLQRSASPVPFAAPGQSGSARPRDSEDTAPIAKSLSLTLMSSGGAVPGDAMPFSRRTPPPTSTSAAEPTLGLDHTAMLSGPVHLGAALPFGGAAGPTEVLSPETLRKQVSLTVYAAICAEIAVHPERAESVFTRYGLADRTLRYAVDALYKSDFATDPAVRAKFDEIVARAKTILI